MPVCTPIYMSMHMRAHTCQSIYLNTRLYISLSTRLTHVYTHAYPNVYTHVHTRVQTHVDTQAYTHAYTHKLSHMPAHMSIHMSTRMPIHISILMSTHISTHVCGHSWADMQIHYRAIRETTLPSALNDRQRCRLVTRAWLNISQDISPDICRQGLASTR